MIHVLNTRPRPDNMLLTEALRAVHIDVTELPLIEFEVLLLPADEQQQLMGIANMDVVVVISPTAAKLGLAQLKAMTVTSISASQWIAVGSGTQRVLEQAGIHAQVPLLENSEGVLALGQIEALHAGQRVMVWRGEGGRELVAQQLNQRGVHLHTITLYRRLCPRQLSQDWQKIAPQLTQHVVVLISSELSWQHWRVLVGENIKQFSYAVLGNRLAQVLHVDGLTATYVLHNLRPQHVVDVLVEPSGEDES